MGIKKLIISIVCSLAIISQASISYAQELSPTTNPTPAPIEYQLPYPGILPDHPFYFLKNIRDKIMSFLISSPLKKAEFYLLQSDKNLQATVSLYEQNKDRKTVFQTLQKSEDYFQKAIDAAWQAKKQGINILEFEHKITIANLKHQEVVLSLSKSATSAEKKEFEDSLKRLKILEEKTKALNPK
jgi:hypothetical protein